MRLPMCGLLFMFLRRYRACNVNDFDIMSSFLRSLTFLQLRLLSLLLSRFSTAEFIQYLRLFDWFSIYIPLRALPSV